MPTTVSPSRYFSEASTQEMLDEWLPLMCPFDVTMHKAVAYLELFLPTMLPPEQHHRGFRWAPPVAPFFPSVVALCKV